MQTAYEIWAHSPSLNQQIRRFDLTDMKPILNEQQAKQDADNFAELQNINRFLHATDWIGQVVLNQHGIDTIPGYIG